MVRPYGEGGLIPVSLVEPGEDCDADNTDSNVDHFSLGRVGRAVANPNLESEDVIGAPGCSRLPTQDDPAQVMPGEPSEYTQEE